MAAVRIETVLATAERLLIDNSELYLIQSLIKNLLTGDDKKLAHIAYILKKNPLFFRHNDFKPLLADPSVKVLCNYIFIGINQTFNVEAPTLTITPADWCSFLLRVSLSTSFLRLREQIKEQSQFDNAGKCLVEVEKNLAENPGALRGLSLIKNTRGTQDKHSPIQAEIAESFPVFNDAVLQEGLGLVWLAINNLSHQHRETARQLFIDTLKKIDRDEINIRDKSAVLTAFFRILHMKNEAVLLIETPDDLTQALQKLCLSLLKQEIDTLELHEQKLLAASYNRLLENNVDSEHKKILENFGKQYQESAYKFLHDELGIMWEAYQRQDKMIDVFLFGKQAVELVLRHVDGNVKKYFNELCKFTPSSVDGFEKHIDKFREDKTLGASFNAVLNSWKYRIKIGHDDTITQLTSEYKRLISIEKHANEFEDIFEDMRKDPAFPVLMQKNDLAKLLDKSYTDLQKYYLYDDRRPHNHFSQFKSEFERFKKSYCRVKDKLNDAGSAEKIIFEKFSYPTSYQKFNCADASPLQNTLSLLRDYASKGFFSLHPNRNHQVLAYDMVKDLQKLGAQDNYTLEKMKLYINKVKNKLIIQEKLIVDKARRPSSFLCRLHFANDILTQPFQHLPIAALR